MRSLQRIVLAAALLLIGCATTMEERRWIQVESDHFRLISGAGKGETIRIALGDIGRRP